MLGKRHEVWIGIRTDKLVQGQEIETKLMPFMMRRLGSRLLEGLQRFGDMNRLLGAVEEDELRVTARDVVVAESGTLRRFFQRGEDLQSRFKAVGVALIASVEHTKACARPE